MKNDEADFWNNLPPFAKIAAVSLASLVVIVIGLCLCIVIVYLVKLGWHIALTIGE
jgi:hypothetical protein